jgi:hypothetical protein
LIDRYRWAGGEGFYLTFGAKYPIQIIVIPPLFEEANRMRHIIVSAMRALEALEIGSALPDLPGMGESPHALLDVGVADWRAALQAFSKDREGYTISAAFRGGALIDDAAQTDAAWRCAPETGQRLVRDLMRTRLTSTGEVVTGNTLVLAGNHMRQSMIDALQVASPAPLQNVRTVRLTTDAADADAKIAGTPVWRRSEPGDDDVLLASIVEDLSEWAKQCAGY